MSTHSEQATPAPIALGPDEGDAYWFLVYRAPDDFAHHIGRRASVLAVTAPFLRKGLRYA